VSTVISAFNSLTLSPALTALLLRPRDKGTAPPLPRFVFPLAGAWLGWEFLVPQIADFRLPIADWQFGQSEIYNLQSAICMLTGAAAGWMVSRPLNAILGMFFRAFNAGFGRAIGAYARVVGGLLRVSILVLLVYGGLLALTYLGFDKAPKGFLPAQDK